MGACTGGAGSCFQNEWSVDFCGLDKDVAGWCNEMASEGTGEAFGWLRCAAKSFCRVFSGHSQYTKKRIHVNGKVPTVYSTLIRAIVAEPFTRPVAPVAALHTADTRKIPAIVS
mgnify:CR=1 FL=1|jgi:hypothetical protein